ncbi:hypothetical protein [Prauserella cavernicola]|uniref:Uncharacterized protein n=1 Tax=Prauserella cavernicola TaxID=2800127 RepID=A0A934QTZ5_9PSEU|nr:hypothetical protein [Prauserella cavernicola]MBK1785584.1 hypothetical protein [Prauserella cavernicola]
MMVTINYPAWQARDLYMVVIRDGGRFYPTDETLYYTRAYAEDALRSLAAPGRDLTILYYDGSFYARCVVCGEVCDPDYWVFLSWGELEDFLWDEPGWQATNEHHVFCPHHAPHQDWRGW